MGNQHSASHAVLKPRKNVHWKSAGRPAAPGKPEIIPILSDDEPNSITLRWAPSAHDGGAPLKGYQVECNRLGSPEWIRTAPPVVLRPELVLSGLEPPHRYQFRVAALNIVGRSEYSDLSDVLTVSTERGLQEPPMFLQHLEDVTVLENDKTEFRVSFSGSPPPSIAWFKDDYQIFSSRRTAISTNESSSVLIFHQTLSSDEGEIKCSATNRAGHAVTKARLSLEAAPKLRYPRQYEDGLLYEINETVFLKTTIVGKPAPTIEWRHDGQIILGDGRVEITNTSKFSILKIHSARRSDRGEYQIHAKNTIGEDTAAFLVTITAPPDPPRRVSVTRQVDKSVTLDWEPPEDDGGCRIGNYVIEYYRSGWNVWLKATTSRKTNVTLFDLIEGSEYRFRVKAESPYGMSAPSAESATVKIPGRSVDMEFLEVESRIINEVIKKDDSQVIMVSPAPRRKRSSASASVTITPDPGDREPELMPEPEPKAKMRAVQQRARASPTRDHSGSSEFMLVLYPDNVKSADKAEKRKSFQLDLEDALSPPPISLSAPELSSRCVMPFKALRNAVSSTELLHEQAMARFYKAVAMKEEQSKPKVERPIKPEQNHIPYNNIDRTVNNVNEIQKPKQITKESINTPAVMNKKDSMEEKDLIPKQIRQDTENSDNKWQHMSFDEDYTASTVSTDGDYSDEGSLNGEIDRASQYSNEEETYNPRDKITRSMSPKEMTDLEEVEEEEELEREPLKPLPVPDPNFIPKPILKRREHSEPDVKVMPETTTSKEETKIIERKREDKMSIFKKITKMPVQKSFPFPKTSNKKDLQKNHEEHAQKVENKSVKKAEKIDDKFGDEGRTIIDYYGNIVKEYGSNKKPATPLYLNTEDLKNVAEKQQSNKANNVSEEKKIVKKKIVVKKSEQNVTPNKTKPIQSKPEKPSPKVNSNVVKLKPEINERVPSPKPPDKVNKPLDRAVKPLTQSKLIDKNPQATQILLRKAERATIVIPIDYQKLEERAKLNVRSAIDYTVDVCLLLLAFWVYFFKDERLAIPFLILIIYRQLQETLFLNFPEWISRHTPSWLKRKSS